MFDWATIWLTWWRASAFRISQWRFARVVRALRRCIFAGPEWNRIRQRSELRHGVPLGAGPYEELPSLAAELVNLKVAVIAASGRTAVMAAKAATSIIPIIFLIGGDPVRLRLVSGFHKPWGNASGVTILTLALDLQRLRLLREALARTASIAVLFNPNFPRAEGRMREVQEAAQVGARSVHNAR
jgi:ABC transporter substrate binding protein